MEESDRPSVLLVAHQYWPTPGSATQVMSALVRELRARNFPVVVATTGDPVDGRRVLDGPYGERVYLVAAAESSGASIKRLVDLAAFAWGAHRLGRDVRPHIVISDPPPTATWTASRLARSPRCEAFVYYFSDSWAAVTQDSDSLFTRSFSGLAGSLERYALRASDITVAVTAELGRMAKGIGASTVLDVLNGIDTEVFTDVGPSWYPTPEKRPFLLYAGKAGIVHGAEVFGQGAERLWQEGLQFDCVYMGYGTGGDDVAQIARRWPDRLHLVPTQTPTTVAAAYRTAAGALSSLRPMPHYAHARLMKALSGLACGCPAVFCGVGEFADTIRVNELGFVHAWSPEGAAAGIRQALDVASGEDFPAWRTRLRRYAREHFDERAGARTVVDALQGLLASKGV